MIDSFLACIMLWGVMLFCAVAETGSIMKALQAHKTDCHKFIHPLRHSSRGGGCCPTSKKAQVKKWSYAESSGLDRLTVLSSHRNSLLFRAPLGCRLEELALRWQLLFHLVTHLLSDLRQRCLVVAGLVVEDDAERADGLSGRVQQDELILKVIAC